MRSRSLRLLIPSWVFLTLLPVLLASADSNVDAALTLQTIELFHNAAKTEAMKPITELEESYRIKLENRQKAAQEAGNLKSLTSAKQAIDDLNAGRISALSEDPEVASIQKAYMVQRKQVGAACDKALAKAGQEHLASLKKLVVDLTKSGHIDQAQEVQAKADEIEASLVPKDAAAATAPAGGPEVETWKNKALGEFPDLRNPNSKLSLRVKALKEDKASNPGYFSDPRWPYLLAQEANTPNVVYLDDLEEFNVRVAVGTLGKHGAMHEGKEFALIDGVRPKHSLLPHPPARGASSVCYQLDRKYRSFSGTATVADRAQKRSLDFTIKGDGKILWRSKPIQTNKDAQKFDISVENVSTIQLDVNCPDVNWSAWGVWVEPKLSRGP